jgi:hypothetical protein
VRSKTPLVDRRAGQTEKEGAAPGTFPEDKPSRPLARRSDALLPPDGLNRSKTRESNSDRQAASARRWGAGSSAGRIGFERSVKIDVHADRLTVAKAGELQFAEDADRDTVRKACAAAIDAAVRSWGSPPEGFYWMPRVAFRIYPGGNLHTARLKGLAEEWGLSVTVEQELEDE